MPIDTIQKKVVNVFYFNRYNLKSIDGMENVKEKLRPYIDKLKNRREVLSGQIKYFHLQWPRNEAFFRTGNKIICATRTDKPSFTFTKESFYASRALNIILTDRISNHILTALLNSKLSHYWFKYKGKLTGNLLQIDKNQLLTFPISNIGRIEEELISSYIKKIIAVKQNNVMQIFLI